MIFVPPRLSPVLPGHFYITSSPHCRLLDVTLAALAALSVAVIILAMSVSWFLERHSALLFTLLTLNITSEDQRYFLATYL
ncbi:hypothetical protein E2C01_077515 [Portunus trituberculatus]|uniref:Uncharacterized protein n=1 Tax=Portunus trituberculatus TaxID=210409 RepID=A0A5B7ILK4_PORTR|nr:hypothetical protein [Portunus trituberculatus]